ncbi:disease resistance protein At4g27190-like [Cornus florida]|uniref:disease resistance protein At4g27190-like n=1 Tax=Cornus florida TaxID=4283 RepID=UPI0028968451|nr:disease resistance protein At4g27190-like [Cornus florida]
MDVVDTIVGKMLEPMIELLFTSTRRQIGYVFHYKHNIKSFEVEVENLRACMKRVQDDVEMAKDNGMVVEEDVSKWLEKVERSLITFEEVTKLLQDRQNLCCLDVCSRHQLGREGKKKSLVVTGLKDEGKFETHARTPHLTGIWNVSSTNFEQFESRNSVFNKIMEAMKDDSNYKIGIYGMPGVGKTTMVEEAGKQAEKGLFDEVAMAVFSQNPDLTKIQEKLADCLNLELKKKSEEGRAAELRNRLKNGRKILVILDDLWGDQITLKKIGIPDDIDNSKGCKIYIDDLVKYGVGTGFLRSSDTMKKKRDRAKTLGNILKKSNLLLEGKDENSVKMHDVIRDVAISIASKDSNVFLVKDVVNVWPEKNDYRRCTAISLRTSHNVSRLPDQLVCRELRTLVLGCNTPGGSQLLELPSNFFKWVENLEVLDLYRINLLQSSLSNLVNLRMLRLHYCKLVDLSFLKNFKILDILSIDDDFQHKLMVDEVVQLNHLRSLDLRKCNCEMAEIFQSGVLSHLSGLEELYLPLRFDTWGDEGNVSIAELHCLSSLTSLHIRIPKHIILLPKNDLPSFQSLTTFHIWIGDYDGRCNHEYTKTKILGLKNVPWKIEFNVLMKNVEVLFLLNSEGAKKVLHHIDGEWFLDLESLKVKNCHDMEYLLGKPHTPCPLGSFGKLSILEVGKCRSIKYLFSPSTARCLSNLHNLTITNCEMLEEIVGGDEDVMDNVFFGQLKKLWLVNLPNIRSIYSDTKKTSTTECNPSTIEQALFNEKINCPVLEVLDIQKLNSIIAICDNQLLPVQEANTSHEITMFTKLKILRLDELPSLKSFCKSCDSEKEEISEEGISEIQALFNCKVTLPVLEKLFIRKLNSITAIWDKLLLPVQEAKNSFQYLQILNVRDCEKMKKIIGFEIGQGKEAEASDEIAMFTQLKLMALEELPSLKSFCYCGSEVEKTSEEGIPQIRTLLNCKAHA